MVNGHCHVKIVKLYAKERTLMCMNSITKNRLIDSGWKEQRKINTDAETIYKQLREKEE